MSGVGFCKAARTPLSASRFSQEKSGWGKRCGNLATMAETFSAACSTVGRDLGGVPDKVPRIAVCGAICNKTIKANPQLETLLSWLGDTLRAVVKRNGGVRNIPTVQPSGPYRARLQQHRHRHLRCKMHRSSVLSS